MSSRIHYYAGRLGHRLREPDRSSPMRIRFLPFPTQPVVEPDRSLSTPDVFQVVAVLVGEYQLAGFGQSNEEFSFLGVFVTARAEGDQELGESLTALAVALDVVDLQEEMVGAARRSAAVTIAP